MESSVESIELIRSTGRTSAESRAIERAAQRGDLERVCPATFVAPGTLDGLDPRARHQLLVRALLPRLGPERVVSHLSAAAVRGWPHVGLWPRKVHTRTMRHERTSTTAWFVNHGALTTLRPRDEPDVGVPLASDARTVVDLAGALPLHEAVPIIDHALRTPSVTAERLAEELSTNGSVAPEQARYAIDFGSALADSPAESLCRVRFRQLRTVKPIEQQHFRLLDGRDVFVDFWFPNEGVIVEVDGRQKYDDPAMRGGRTIAQVHWDEKRRENALSALPGVRRVVRLTWDDLMHPERMRAVLRAAGIACR